MADLDPLIRFRKHGVEEKQRLLAQLYREAEALEKQKQIILDQIEKEKKLAEEMASPDAAAFLGGYLQGARAKVRALDTSIRKMEGRIAAAQEDMRAAFAEMKKVEITQRKRKEREKAEEKHKEEQELDDIAIENYRRRLEEDED